MAEMADSDPEIVFQSRHNGDGERFHAESNKMCQQNESCSESGDEDRVDVQASLQDNFRLSEREIRNRNFERIPIRQRMSQLNDPAVFHPETKLLMKPDVFNGEGDWEAYKAHFEVCAELGGWSPRVMALTLASRLQGQAQVFYMNLPEDQKNSYPELVSFLSQRFGYARQKSKWAALLESCQRGPGETISKLGDEIRRLTRRAHSDLDSTAQEAIALKQLYKSLSPEMKYKCIVEPCITVAQAVDLIEIYEGVVGGEHNKKKSVVRVAREESDNPGGMKAIETGLNEVQQTMKQVIKRIERLEAKDKKSCFICESPDHFMNRCPQNNKQGNQRYHQNKQSFKKSYQNQQSAN